MENNQQEKKVINPYEAMKKVEKKLDELSEREKRIKSMSQREQKLLRNELEEVETKQLFLFIEKEVYQNCINWLEIYKKGWEEANAKGSQ